MKFDRLIPYNNLPTLPPIIELEENQVILKKLVLASRALATVNGNLNRGELGYGPNMARFIIPKETKEPL